jgi:VanZ family protein
MTAMKRRVFWWILVVLWCGLIFFFTKSPIFTGENTANLIDRTTQISDSVILTYANIAIRKLAHIFAFGILAFLLWKSIQPGRWSFVIAWGLATIYAVTDEWHQSLVPNRSGSIQDVMLDSAGALLFLGIIYLLKKRR